MRNWSASRRWPLRRLWPDLVCRGRAAGTRPSASIRERCVLEAYGSSSDSRFRILGQTGNCQPAAVHGLRRVRAGTLVHAGPLRYCPTMGCRAGACSGQAPPHSGRRPCKQTGTPPPWPMAGNLRRLSSRTVTNKTRHAKTSKGDLRPTAVRRGRAEALTADSAVSGGFPKYRSTWCLKRNDEDWVSRM